MGVGSSLIYAPAFFAETAGADRARDRGGQMRRHVYQPHARRGAEAARGDRRAGRDLARRRARRPKSTISSSRAAPIGARSTRRSPGSRRRGRAGLRITADMYTYPASSTGLDAAMPLWVQEGGIEAWVERLKDPALRARALAEMRSRQRSENSEAGRPASPTRCSCSASRTPALKPLTGRTLEEVARERGKTRRGDRRRPHRRGRQPNPGRLFLDERGQCPPRGGAAVDELRLRRRPPRRPRACSCKSSTHPRAYGNFARVLGKYRRATRRSVTLQEAVRRMTSLPAGQSRPQGPRRAQARPFRRPRHLRSGDDPRQRHLRRSRSNTPPACATSSSTASRC